MSDYAVMPYSDYKDICDSVRAKTGGTETLKSGEVAAAIDGIQAGGGAEELIYETTFEVAETITATSRVSVASIETGLTKEDYAPGFLYFVVIKCTDDAEPDMSIAHFRERFQTIADSGEGYPAAGVQSGTIYFTKSDGTIVSYGGAQGGAFIYNASKFLGNLYVYSYGSSNSGGFVCAGTYSLKLYKVNIAFFGLEGVPNA